MKRILTVVVVLLIGVAVAYGYSVTRRERTYRRLIDRGDQALARGDTFAAIETFSGAIALKSDSMVAYLRRGEAYRRRNELEAAMRDLLQAAEIDPTAPRPYELLGDVNFATVRYARAAERYQQYLALDDQSPRVLYKLALAQYRAGRCNAGIDALKKALAIDDRFAEAYYLLALCLSDTQKMTAAIASLQRAIALAPTLVHAREELAEVYGRLGRARDRVTQLEALMALDPGPSRQVALGLAYARIGQAGRAVLTLGDAIERYPDHRYTYVALGRVWLDTAQSRSDSVALSKALEALEQAVSADATSEALTLFGRALLLAADDQLAERTLQEATAKTPVDPLALYYLAEAAERRGHADIARQALLDYRALEGDELEPRRRGTLAARVADLSIRLNQPGVALPWYRRALEATPADTGLLVRYAEAQWKAGDAPGARASIDSALQKDPENGIARALRRRIR